MPENFLYNLIYSLIAGLTEFLGVDAASHRLLLAFMAGQNQADPALLLALRIGVLAAVIFSCRKRLQHLWRQRRISLRSRRRHNRPLDPVAQLDLRLLKTAAIPVLISILLYSRAEGMITGLLPLTLVLVLNGILLFLPRLFSQGNKDGRSVSRLDGVLLGLGGALAAVPGFSTVGSLFSIGSARGLDKNYALDVALILSVPALVGLLVFDIVTVIAAKVAIDLIGLLLHLLYAAVAFGGGCLSILIVRRITLKSSLTGFAYYSLGFALFTFVLYLMI
ncbi:MAG: undecaprenyl-diphosphate phosphatase [Oscillospiraceae bacterium]|nr:undecaprenyl-diphosphate phosphatase [Oscillospiraceae bacterium]